MKKQTIISYSVAGLMLVGLATPKPTQAFWPFDAFKSNEIVEANADRPNYMQSLMDKLVSKFNLNQTDVESVFSEVRDEKHEYMESRMADRLTQAVEDGKLTEDQKQLIIQKHEELEASRPDWSADREAMRETMQAHHEELQQWAQDNDIPLEFLNMGGYGRGGKGMGGMNRGQR